MKIRIALVGLHFFFSHLYCSAFVVQCNRTTVQSEACWCIRRKFFFFFSFLVNIIVGRFFYHFPELANYGNSLWLLDHVGGGNGEA